MAVVEVFPTVCGVGLLIIIVLAAIVRSLTDPPREDRVAQYREGLDAANRMQRAAQDLEQQIYAEAARHMDGDSKGQSR
jgi:hypothetical protein